MGLISGRRPGTGTWRMVAALVRQRRRLALATLAIALGVGYLAGALTLLDRVSEGLDDLAAAGAERADLVVEGDVAYESALEQTRRLVPVSVGESLREVPGVAAVMPRVEEITMLLDSEGIPLVSPGLSEQPLGTNWPEDEQMSPYRFVGDGRGPEAADEVVIDEVSARRAGVEVGDTIVAVARGGPGSFRVVGIVTTDEGPLPAGSSLALFTTEQARVLFDARDNDNRVAIRVEDGADPESVRASIQAALPSGTELVDGATAAKHRQENLTRSFALIRVLIMGFAGLALVVGMVTVANSLTLLYAERRRTLAAFRLVGAKQHQLLLAALIEAALLAAVASLLGVPLGLAFGRFIEFVLGALGTSIPVGGSAVSLRALGTALAVGVLATVLAAVIPARRACRVPAVEAVVESPSDPPGSTLQRMTDAALVALGIGVAVAGLLLLADVDVAVAAAVGGVVVVVWILAALLPTALSAMVALGIWLVPLRPRTLRRIGARDAIRNRSRTAATTGALLMATTVVAGLAVFLASFASSIDGDVEHLVSSDLVVDSGTFTRGGLPASLLEDVRVSEGVAAVSGWQVGRGSIEDRPVRLTAIDGGALGSVLSPAWVDEGPSTLSPLGLLVEERTAQELGLRIGDQVPVMFHSGGYEMLTLEGIYGSGAVLLGEAVVDRSTLLRQVPASVDIAALVSLDADSPAVRDTVEEIARSYGVTSVLEPSRFVDSRSDLLRGFERVIQWMLFFTLAQALVGVINTLLLSVGERRRQFGLLRAAGAGARQIHRLVLAEGMSFAVVGTVLGLVAGTVAGALAIRSLARFGISGVDIPVISLLATGVLAVALGVAAAVIPARFAAAVPPLEAVSDAGVGGVVRTAAIGPALRDLVRRRRRGRRIGPVFTPSRPSPQAAHLAVAGGPAGTPSAQGWLRQGVEAGQGRGEARPRTEAAAETDRVVFAPVPRSDAPPVPVGPRPARGWRTGGDTVASDRVAAIRLAPVLGRLDPLTVRDAQPALVPLARELEPDERIGALVQGWAKGLLCLVVRTDRRLLVIVDRFPEPLVESLDPERTGVQLYGPPGTDRVSVSVVDGNRLLEVIGVRDRAEGARLRVAPAEPSDPEPVGEHAADPPVTVTRPPAAHGGGPGPRAESGYF